MDSFGIAQFRDSLIAKLDNEVDQLPYNTIIFSNEHLSSRVRKREDIRSIKTICQRYAKNTKVVVYLRNQVDFLVSSYGTVLKGGGSRRFPFPLGARRRSGMDYDTLISTWSHEFGIDNLIVRRFETNDFVRGDFLTDFAAAISLDMPDLDRVDPRNEALSARGLAFLREFNKRIPRLVDGIENPARGNIVGALVRACAGPPLTVPAAVAETIMKEFAESNGRVSAQYFNGRFDPLFLPPRYVGDADVETQLSLRFDEAVDIAAQLWADQQAHSARRSRRRKKRRERGEVLTAG